MFSLFARRLPRTTLSAIQLCARGVASVSGPTNAVYLEIIQQNTSKITYPALKEGLATFGDVERLWLKMPTGRHGIVTFKDQEAAEKLMAKKTLEIPPAILAAQNFAGPAREQINNSRSKFRQVDDQKSPRLILHNIAAEFGVSATDIAKVFSQFGKVSVRHRTLLAHYFRVSFPAYETLSYFCWIPSPLRFPYL